MQGRLRPDISSRILSESPQEQLGLQFEPTGSSDFHVEIRSVCRIATMEVTFSNYVGPADAKTENSNPSEIRNVVERKPFRPDCMCSTKGRSVFLKVKILSDSTIAPFLSFGFRSSTTGM